jgi:glycosyltransferase involved in cell wall biosynthesis
MRPEASTSQVIARKSDTMSVIRFGNVSASRRPRPEVSLLVSTYQKPRHLRLALASVAMQQGVSEKLELVVTDDGSTDETLAVVEEFAAAADLPVAFTTHQRSTFQLAKCRNEGVAASAAPYLIFTDGDLILPPDFVWQHLKRRQTNAAYTGDCYRLTEMVSQQIDDAAVRSGAYRELVSADEVWRVRKADRMARWHALLRHRHRPHLIGGNVGMWRSDYERVNGYDENFQGWGCEDDDLAHRIRASGIRIHSINRWTCAYHVWHPRDVTMPAAWHDGANVVYYLRKQRRIRCLNGLSKLEAEHAPIEQGGRWRAA